VFEKQKLKYLAVLAVILVAVALIQATPLAFLPHSADSVVEGCALGGITGLVIGWLINRHISVKE
jgi:hypothetical protein